MGRRNHAFVSDADVSFSDAVGFVAIRRRTSRKHLQLENIFAVFASRRENKIRIRINPLLNKSADCLCIALRIGQTDNISVVVNAENQRSADAVCKCADAFEPAFRLLSLQSNLKIAFARFCNPQVFHCSSP